MGTVIQTRFVGEEYDIDDGLVLWREQLVDENGVELTAQQVKEKCAMRWRMIGSTGNQKFAETVFAFFTVMKTKKSITSISLSTDAISM